MAHFSESDKKLLIKCPHILKVTDSKVTYSPNFKIHAVEQNLKGIPAKRIFKDAGINITIFGFDYAKKCIQRWRRVHERLGVKGLEEEQRGKGSTGRPKKTYNPNDIKSVKERLAYLEAENDFLKKLHALAKKYQKKKDTL